jgi:predicted dehydrogenase
MSSILIVGLGSIGKRHLEILSGNGFIIHVVDPSPEVEEYLIPLARSENIEYFESLEKFVATGVKPDITTISNLGPQHYSTFKVVQSLGCKKIFIEKPLASRIVDVQNIIEASRSEKIDLRMNLPLSKSNFLEKLENIQANQNLGSVESIVVFGGAKCIITIGVHYLALASRIFEGPPISCWSKMKTDPINPRSASLKYFEGVACWQYPNNKNLIINFSNSSNNQAYMILNFQRGYAIVEGEKISVMKIDDSDLQRIDKPTKTFFSTLAYTQGNIFEGFLATESDYTQYLNYQLKDETTEIQQNMDGLFGVLISNQLNSINIELPLVPELVSSFFEFEWDIS